MGFHLCGILMTVRLSWESSLGAVQMSGVLQLLVRLPSDICSCGAVGCTPTPNKESKGAASSTGVLTCDEIRKYEIGLFQTGREGA